MLNTGGFTLMGVRGVLCRALCWSRRLRRSGRAVSSPCLKISRKAPREKVLLDFAHHDEYAEGQQAEGQ